MSKAYWEIELLIRPSWKGCLEPKYARTEKRLELKSVVGKNWFRIFCYHTDASLEILM